MKLFYNNNIFNEIPYEREAEFERAVVQNSKLFFGSNSVYIDVKRRIDTIALGNTIPDGYLFDLSDINYPEFYIVEVELASHNFFDHIFPQITRFFGFFRNQRSRDELISKLFKYINDDVALRTDLVSRIGNAEVYKFLKDTIEKSQNILLLLDNPKPELSEIFDTYTDTWGKLVKLALIKRYANGEQTIFTMHPEFESIEIVEFTDRPVSNETDAEQEYDVEDHLDGISEEIKDIFKALIQYSTTLPQATTLNPTKSYISIRSRVNLAFFKLRRKKIILIVPFSPEQVEEIIHHYSIKRLPESVEKFWFGGNSRACAISIEDAQNLDEVKQLLRNAIERY